MKINKDALIGYFIKHGLPPALAEHRFHPTRRWRFDFAWPLERVALEVDGGVFGIGRPCPRCHQRKMVGHNRGAQMKKTWEKENTAMAMGWRIIRCTPSDAKKGLPIPFLQMAIYGPGL